jgi:hypothetical protein
LAITLLVLCTAASAGQTVASPAFSGTSKRAVFLSPLENWMPTWNIDSYVKPLESAGYAVDVVLGKNASMAFLSSQLPNYDIVILRTDAFDHEGRAYYCSGDDPFDSKTKTTYGGEISTRDLAIGACLGFSGTYMQHSYPAGSMRHGLFFALGSGLEELSAIMLTAGFDVFVTYSMSALSLQWGRYDALSEGFFKYLGQGSTVKNSIIELNQYLRRGHGLTADWPMIYYCGDGNFVL